MKTNKKNKRVINKGLVVLASILIVMTSMIIENNIAEAFESSKADVINIYDKGSVIINIEDEELREKILSALDQISDEMSKEEMNEIEDNNEKESIIVDSPIIEMSLDYAINTDVEIRKAKAKENAELQKEREKEESHKREMEDRKRKLREKKQAEEERLRKEERKISKNNVNRGNIVRTTSTSLGTFEATAYDLSPASVGEFGGMVASGKIHLSGHSRQSAQCIAVDPNVIPLGSVVKVTVPSMPEYNGEYIAYDTGGAIKGNRIDVFVGDFPGMTKEAYRFGRRKVQIEIVGRAW